MNTFQFISAIEIGLIYALVAIGTYMSFRIIDFPDLTVDGSFVTGGAVSTVMIVMGIHPLVATTCGMLAGCMAGALTAYLHVQWQMLGLLAGILTMTALYSINLRIMSKPNITLIDETTLFSNQPAWLIALWITVSVILLMAWFFKTELGLAIRAVGINPKISGSYGIKTGTMKLITLSLSNGIVALSGALFAQSQGFVDIGMGTGTIIVGLASLILGETLFRTNKIMFLLVACTMGSIFYRLAIACALNTHSLGLQSSDLNLITALLVAITMIIPKLKKRIPSYDKA